MSHDELDVGSALPTLTRQPSADQIRAFEECNVKIMGVPLRENFHTNMEEARKAGLDQPVASAMLTTTLIVEMLGDAFGSDWTRSGHLNLKFIASVRANDALTTRGTVSGSEDTSEGRKLSMEVSCEKAPGTVVTVGTADVVVTTHGGEQR